MAFGILITMPSCLHCGTSFTVLPDDLALLKKLSPVIGDVPYPFPPPTLCPECRQQRRMSFRNERHLHRRKCDVTGQDIISVFPAGSPYTVCEKNHWYSDKFDPFAYGRPFDFNRPFFEQFKELTLAVPLPSLRVELSENCEFNNDMRACQNCYLCMRTHQSQNLMYTYRGNKSSDCVDCTQVTKCEHLYECVECVKCQQSRYLFFCIDCASSAFLLDCRNCLDCFMCCNLRSKRHCFLNEQLTKEAYDAKLKEFNFSSRKMVTLAKKMYEDIRKKAIRRALMISSSEDVTGDNILESKHCHACFGVQGCRDGRYLWDVKLHSDAMDEYSGGRDSELMYETTASSGSFDVQCSLRASDSQHIRYSYFLTSCKHLFGCVGLRRSEYCIFNKQYSKEEYEVLAVKIIAHMKRTKEYGEFFPASLSPFAYNETVAHEYFPLTEQAAKKLGYRWREDEPRSGKEQIYTVPDTITTVQDDVTQQTLRCETCKKNYKIVAQELAFYREHSIPVPSQCPDCRHLARFHMKNPPRLRAGTCGKCEKDIETSFPIDCPEIIYCERCYLETVY